MVMALPLYLASTSPRRNEILTQHGVPYKTIENTLQTEPKIAPFERPTEYVMRVAFAKANASKSNHQGVVLGVDTVVAFEGEIFGKPESLDEAINMITKLSGKTHQVITACALYDALNQAWLFCMDDAEVTFKPKMESIIHDYVHAHQPVDKAGGYGIQDTPPFIEKTSGDFYTIMGLPINRLLKIFSHYGIVK